MTPGADPTEPDAIGEDESLHRRLLALAREADAFCGEHDEKLKKAAKLIKELLKDGYRPIVFCRFIPTAEYLAQELRSRLPKGVEVAAGRPAPCPPPNARIECCNWPSRQNASWYAPTA